MNKTKSYIEAININGGRPKNGTGQYVLVRAPKTMKCFRATFVVNNFGGLQPSSLWIASQPTLQEELCLFLNSYIPTITTVSPGTNQTSNAPGVFILDRRGVGYMEDEFYLYSDECYLTIVWEGISEE